MKYVMLICLEDAYRSWVPTDPGNVLRESKNLALVPGESFGWDSTDEFVERSTII